MFKLIGHRIRRFVPFKKSIFISTDSAYAATLQEARDTIAKSEEIIAKVRELAEPAQKILREDYKRQHIPYENAFTEKIRSLICQKIGLAENTKWLTHSIKDIYFFKNEDLSPSVTIDEYIAERVANDINRTFSTTGDVTGVKVEFFPVHNETCVSISSAIRPKDYMEDPVELLKRAEGK